ncbi:MAG: extracellular solute-binding protein [Holosporales bacterium]|nr:extracellular solute-binding protein [Holosporales bacterium]
MNKRTFRGKIWSIGALSGAFAFILLRSIQEKVPIERISQYGVERAALGPLDTAPVLHLYGWIGFIPPKILADFEALTGIHVIFDVFDACELLETKLFAESSGYDVVFPTAWPYFARELQAGIYQPLDKTRLESVWKLDPNILHRLESIDPGNRYAVPYQWGMMGIGIRARKIKKILGTIPQSWALLFDPSYAAQLKSARIELCDAPGELIPAVLSFLGKNPESESFDDLEAAAAALHAVRPFVTKFNSSGYEDLASGAATVIIGTSGDILRAQRQAAGEEGRTDITCIFPKEGSALWIDVMAIPRDAPHPKNAHAFIAYLLHPRVMASVTAFTMCANAVPVSCRYLPPEIKNNILIYPPQEMRDKCYVEKNMSAEYETARTRIITKIKSEH